MTNIRLEGTSAPEKNQSVRPSSLLIAGLLATAALMIAHALSYRFLTDDAYISFRYARNLADGAGLVFNPGAERVEGYTNFLWVLLLSGCARAGIPLEQSATFLSLACTFGLWGCVSWFALRQTAGGSWPVLALLPPVLLAATRSVAVWSTGGLETRLFETFMVAGILRLIVETQALDRPEGRTRPWAALLFALATLTRPDGLLISLAAVTAALASRPRSWRVRMGWLAVSAFLFATLVGGHYLFRFIYYGSWLPNTFYAKVSGQHWGNMGLRYLAMFALEYGAWSWVPFLAAAVVWYRRQGEPLVPLVFAAAILPHALYIASIGGDHFEYRPLDLYFPFLYLLLGNGAAYLARGRWSKIAVAGGAFLVALLVVELPRQSHAQFPAAYASGFPGAVLSGHAESRYYGRTVNQQTATGYLDPDRSPIYRLPLLRSAALLHQKLLREATSSFVGIRQEEHTRFLATVVSEGLALRALVDRGVLPRDTRIAIDCVGAIPYLSGLHTLDRFGLTDAQVARTAVVNPEFMAHGKYASTQYAQQAGVDLWAADNVFLLWSGSNQRFFAMLEHYARSGEDMSFAAVGDGKYLLVWLPQGAEAARRRFPLVTFSSALDQRAVRAAMAESFRGTSSGQNRR
jgi:hypothetical protein